MAKRSPGCNKVDYFDTHCHLNHEAFTDDFDAVLQRAGEVGVKHILVPGWDVESSQKAVQLAERYPQILAAVGFHPEDWQKASIEAVKKIETLALHPRVVAIGEIGLDYHYDSDHKMEQTELLLKMLALADAVDKPVLIHSRESLDDLLGLIHAWKPRKNIGILHAFEGNLDQAREVIEMGFHLGVGGPLTYKNSSTKKAVFAEIHESAIVLETDAPYLPPTPFRGQRNEPAYLPLVGEQLALLRGKDPKELLGSIYQNSNKMFL